MHTAFIMSHSAIKAPRLKLLFIGKHGVVALRWDLAAGHKGAVHAGSPGGPTAAQPAGRCGRLHASEWAVQALRQYSTPGHGIALTACQLVPALADLSCSQPRFDIHGAHKLTWCRMRRHCCCCLARSRFELNRQVLLMCSGARGPLQTNLRCVSTCLIQHM